MVDPSHDVLGRSLGRDLLSLLGGMLCAGRRRRRRRLVRRGTRRGRGIRRLFPGAARGDGPRLATNLIGRASPAAGSIAVAGTTVIAVSWMHVVMAMGAWHLGDGIVARDRLLVRRRAAAQPAQKRGPHDRYDYQQSQCS